MARWRFCFTSLAAEDPPAPGSLRSAPPPLSSWAFGHALYRPTLCTNVVKSRRGGIRYPVFVLLAQKTWSVTQRHPLDGGSLLRLGDVRGTSLAPEGQRHFALFDICVNACQRTDLNVDASFLECLSMYCASGKGGLGFA